MLHFIENIGEYFATNYFDEDFAQKVIQKTGYKNEDIRRINQKIAALKPEYFKLKQQFLEEKLRVRDKINLSHRFHTRLLEVLGYEASHTRYHDLYPVDDQSVLPVRHILYRGDQPHLMIMEMHAMIRTGDEEPDGLFQQQYNTENKTTQNGLQKYDRRQWKDLFEVPEGTKISPMVINKALSQLFLLPPHRRPQYILLCAGNQYFLLEGEKWFRGSYLRLDLEALFDDAQISRNYYALFYFLLAKDFLAPTAEMILLDQLDEEAHKSAFEVTRDLKEGVIHAVERLANEAVYALGQQGTGYRDIDATRLKDECLTMVYRLLFLFYAESREDLDILPANDEIYLHGYSLEMLRDLEQVPLVTESGKNGYFFHESLSQLFDLLFKGFREGEKENRSFRIRSLDSPLFDPAALQYLNRIRIRNFIWQDVICELSLSRQERGRNRGRISYANLGINQLGSVYESLLAFRGFLAETDYIEVHRKRKRNETSEQAVRRSDSYLVPRHRRDDFDDREIYMEVRADGTEEMRIIPEGTFIYRLSGRDRSDSASYYTPEVLTQTTVKYALKPLLDQLREGKMKARNLLDLTILEPAMGAAAFHNEAIDQIAEAYLTYRQEELGQKVEPDRYREELQKIKAYIALNNVYGVDINPTAIELGKLSLWLNVIHRDMETPFFGYRLGTGNAVIGAWLRVYEEKQIVIDVKNKRAAKRWWEEAPRPLQFGAKKILRRENEIYHFLLPDPGMASSGNIRLLRDAFPREAQRMRDWRREITQPLHQHEYIQLHRISRAIDSLLMEHYKIQSRINTLTRTRTDFFGATEAGEQTSLTYTSYEEKEKLASLRNQRNAPYHKLKQIMDYWCSLWFWDVRHAGDLPSRTQWYDDIESILNIDLTIAFDSSDPENPEEERSPRPHWQIIEKQLSHALSQSPDSLFQNHRAERVQEYAEKYHFFHYQLEFIEVFREKNGFDIAVGNPPWIKIQFEEKGLMSEIYPELMIRRTTAPQVRKLQATFLEDENQRKLYFDENIQNDISALFMNADQNYPLLRGQQTNLYKCIIENGLSWINPDGYLGLLHPEGIYDDPRGYALRKEIYPRMKNHFHFRNGLFLFTDVHDQKTYSINIYQGYKKKIEFYSINNLFHPSTIDGCFIAPPTKEPVAGLKIKNDKTERWEWNTQAHPSRIVRIDSKILKILARTFEDSDDWQGTKLVNIHAKEMIDAIEKIGQFPSSVDRFETRISEGWHETNSINADDIHRETRYPDVQQYEMIYSGPHLFVGNPMYKTPREICTQNSHYDVIDLTRIDEEEVARTNYIPANVTAGYGSTIRGFRRTDGSYDDWLGYYKLTFRKMLSQAGERTLSGAIIPPKSAHVNALISIIFKSDDLLLEFSGLTSSLVFDFFIKTIGASNLTENRIQAIPLGIDDRYKPALFVRTLQLNCLNRYYAPLWEEQYQDSFREEEWSIDDPRLKLFSALTPEWTWDTPLRNYFERRQALVEIDVITAMALGITLEELILMYNIQFPVLQQNEDETWYDTRGNIVFTCSRGLTGVGLDRPDWNRIRDMKAGETYTHTITKSELYEGEEVVYHAPFRKCDRVEDYKRAWEFFEGRF